MRQAAALSGFLLLVAVLCWAGDGQKREFVVIDTSVPITEVSSQPYSKETIGPLRAGTRVEIFEKRDVRTGRFWVTWYRIKLKGKTGWISQYETTGDIIAEDGEGTVTTTRAPGTGKPREAKFDAEAQKAFKTYALKNLAVRSLEYRGEGAIWVKLSPDKYTTEEHVQKIAENLARAYRLQTNFPGPITVTVLDPQQPIVWATGRLP